MENSCAHALADNNVIIISVKNLNIIKFGLNPQTHRGMHLTYVLTLPPFGRITGIRFYGYNLSPCLLGTPCSDRHNRNERCKGNSEVLDLTNNNSRVALASVFQAIG